jgi:(p)ppGpp synthase/HD superfamily hydrolase
MVTTLLDAIKLAIECHDNALDKEGMEPYILHSLRVMLRQNTDHSRMAAVLHDTLENSGLTAEQLSERGYPEPVIEALRLLTRTSPDDYDNYIDNLATNPIARKVKLADLEDNMNVTRLRSLDKHAHNRLDKYLRSWWKLRAIDMESDTQPGRA